MMTRSVSPAVQADAEAIREAIHGVEECTDLAGDVAWLESVAELTSAIDGIFGLLLHDVMAVRPRNPLL
jgi:hypothetical protein